MGRTKKERGKCREETGMGYCPFSGSGHDTACGVATNRAWCACQGMQAKRMVEPVLARQACSGGSSALDMKFLALCRDTKFCVATWRLSGEQKAVATQFLVSQPGLGEAGRPGVAT